MRRAGGGAAAGRNAALSEEQQAVLAYCEAHYSSEQDFPGCVLRVLAAAGTGKTSTLVALAEMLRRSPKHGKVVYLAFNRTAAADAQKRMPAGVEVRTLHSMAFRLQALEAVPCCSTEELAEHLLRFPSWASEIKGFLGNKKREGKHKEVEARKRVALYIVKTMEMFTLSKDAEPAMAYPAACAWHKEADAPGWPGVRQGAAAAKYVAWAKRLFAELRPGARRQQRGGEGAFAKVTFDVFMKACQLDARVIDCSALLVDESQDLSGLPDSVADG
jgi:hypothetical protein